MKCKGRKNSAIGIYADCPADIALNEPCDEDGVQSYWGMACLDLWEPDEPCLYYQGYEIDDQGQLWVECTREDESRKEN